MKIFWGLDFMIQTFMIRRRKIVKGFINPVEDSDNEDDDILETECFSVLNAFMNQ